MLLTALDYTIIGAYVTGTVAAGLWFSRRWRGAEGFFLAGRNVTWPLIGFSLFATNISTEHFVGLAAAGRDTGLVQGGYEWIASYCLIVLAVVFAPQYLRHRVFTIPEFFEKRYGVEARLGLTLYFLAMIVMTKTAVAIYGGARVISHFTSWDATAVMWGIGIVTAAYTIAGGLAAVVYTDFVQAIVLISGSAVLTLAALGQVGGWEGLTAALAAQGQSDMLSMVRPPTDPDLPFSGYLLGNFLIGGMFYWCMDQVNVQRVLAAKDVHHARAGAIFAGFLKILPVFLLALPGVIAVVLFPEIESHDDTYAVLVEKLLGPGLQGLVIAALLAALMSSLSSTFNSASTLVARDLLLRFRPGSSVTAQVRIGRVALGAVMVAGIGVASSGVIQRAGNLWEYLQEVSAYLSVPFAVAGLLGVLTRRINRQGAMAGVVVGMVAALFFMVDAHSRTLGGHLTSPLMTSFLHRSFVAGALAAVTMWLVSLLTPPPRASAEGSPSLSVEGGFDEAAERRSGLGDYRLWATILFCSVTALWWVFR